MKKKIIAAMVFIALLIVTVLFALEKHSSVEQKSSIAATSKNQTPDINAQKISPKKVKPQQRTTERDSETITQKAKPPEKTVVAESGDKSKNTNKNLEEIKSLLIEMNTRITDLERDLEGVRVTQRAGSGSVASAFGSDSIEQEKEALISDDNDDDTNPSPEQLQEQLKAKQYLISLEQQINAEPNQFTSDDITNRYSTLFQGRENWANSVTHNSTECGGNFCKVVVTYDNSLDEFSKFELDAMMLMPTIEDYPHGRVSYSPAEGNKTQVTMYFASKEMGFPLQ